MSLENVKKFTVAAASNTALATKMESILAGKSPSDAADAFSSLGKSEGYDFSSAEALDFRNAFVSQELSDSDLDKVAGGAGSDPYVQAGATYVAGQVAGQVIPIGGNIIGAGVGAAAGTAAAGGSASESTAAGAYAAAGALDEMKSTVNSAVSAVADFFSSW